MEASCIFCDIAEGRSPCHMIVETRLSIAFLDIHPIRAGHALVIPKAHYTDFYRLDEESYLDVMKCARTLAAALHKRYRPQKVGMLIAGFDISHAHVHLVPMHEYHDLTSKILLDGQSLTVTGEELEREANSIRNGLIEIT